jgi:hypothetical protein
MSKSEENDGWFRHGTPLARAFFAKLGIKSPVDDMEPTTEEELKQRHEEYISE